MNETSSTGSNYQVFLYLMQQEKCPTAPSIQLKKRYSCASPDIDPETQQPRGCSKENKALVNCTTSENIKCKPGTGLDNRNFTIEIPCEYTNGYSFETALLLSIFLGMFGVDRFYLGYPAIGLLKLCTLGFMFLGQLVDIILIALQVVRPADGSYYVINYFGPRLTFLQMNNDTYVVPQEPEAEL
ncbi:TM2 domain-containing protein CG10795-like isoform X2 [Limulus polyphemus]|uniref:TM2 domain-containing protein CG10795-like isoform X2 n=1 Tax=Limulus polyphemus TaxID=6850 RepID=A0ABM1T724_LIMPO|nr:TM2 domain-containing protein CG10795-like isoform X2 [Limulus polyphemus]